MRFYILVLAFVLAINIVAGSDCNVNCTGGVEDDLFTKPSTYGAWGLSYVRDGTRPKLQEPHSAVYKRAVISIHGNGRDVYNYYCFGKYAIEDAGLYDETYLIAPRFPLPIDNPPAGAFYWVNSASWKEGGRSHSDTSRISSFEILDDIIVAFNNKTLFPGLVEIIVVGHSAGGQTAQRYAISSGIDSMSTLPIRYVIENSGSYTYLDTSRPVLAPLSLPTCTACIPEEIVSRTYSFAQGGYGNCSEFNDWKMGIANGNVYVNRRTAATIRAEYGQKDIAYIFSQNDTCNTELGNCGCSDSSLDTGCDALEQGYCRLERGIAYYQYLQYYYGTPTHSYDIVPNAAHEGCKVMTSIQSLRAMFPNVILPADCLNSVSVQQSFTVGWQSSGKSFTQWAGTVTTSSLPIYGITLHITAPSGAEVTSVWGIAPVTPGSSYYKVQDWRLQSGRPVPPNSSLSFGYIVSSTTKAGIVVENASCKK